MTATKASAIGVAVGLAWACGLRAWMTHLAIEFGDWPAYTWNGTFLQVIVPAMIVGGLIGLDWQRRTESGSHVPLVTWSPLLLVLAPAVLAEGFVGRLMETGEGGGAIGVVSIGMLGGFAISRRGSVWARALTGVLATATTSIMVYSFYFQGQGLTASGMFGGVNLVVLMVWLVLGCAIPMRWSSSLVETEPWSTRNRTENGFSSVGKRQSDHSRSVGRE